jgi:HlyD family secretion protein
VYVSTKVSGQIVKMNVEQGDFVVAGKTVIAVIEKDNYQARFRAADADWKKARAEVVRLAADIERADAEIARAAAELARTEADIDKADADVSRSEADVEKADAEVKRYEVLARNALDRFQDVEMQYKRNAATPFELRDAAAARDAAGLQVDWAKAQMTIARRALTWSKAARSSTAAGKKSSQAQVAAAAAGKKQALAAVDVARAQVDAAAAVRDLEHKRLSDCDVIAPITGVVVERSAEVGDFVAAEGGRGGIANSQFVTLADMTRLRVEVDITEQDIAKLAKDMPCTVIPEAYRDRRYDGKVMWVDPQGNYSKATVQVKVRIFSPDAHLRIEGAVKVEFRPLGSEAQAGRPPAIWLPDSAVDGLPSAPRVQTLEGNRIRIVPVKVGDRSGKQVQILSGLTAGATVVSEFRPDLPDGRIIRPPAGN